MRQVEQVERDGDGALRGDRDDGHRGAPSIGNDLDCIVAADDDKPLGRNGVGERFGLSIERGQRGIDAGE